MHEEHAVMIDVHRHLGTTPEDTEHAKYHYEDLRLR